MTVEELYLLCSNWLPNTRVSVGCEFGRTQVATLWIKELDFTGCVMDCEVHFK